MENEKLILSEICSVFGHTLTYSEAKGALMELQYNMNDTSYDTSYGTPVYVDFFFKLDGNEYRIIHEFYIWEIYVEEIKCTVKDSYDLKRDIPSYVSIEIDWDQTAKNCLVDGYGNTFSSYDGSENNAGNYYIFRTN